MECNNPVITSPMVNFLFLDFDGVLHPQYDGEPTPKEVCFCHLPRFEAVMRRHPGVQIVISSTWRQQFGMRGRRALKFISRPWNSWFSDSQKNRNRINRIRRSLHINQAIILQSHITSSQRRKHNIFFSAYTARANNL